MFVKVTTAVALRVEWDPDLLRSVILPQLSGKARSFPMTDSKIRQDEKFALLQAKQTFPILRLSTGIHVHGWYDNGLRRISRSVGY